eukprot:gene3446-3717_t
MHTKVGHAASNIVPFQVIMVSLVNSSSSPVDFSCSWLQYQGLVSERHQADVAVWLRPIPVGRYVLYNTNLSSWRASGASTVTVQQVQAAVAEVAGANPQLPVSQLLQQPAIQQLLRVSEMVDQQLAADEQQAAAPQGQQQSAAAGQQATDSAAGGRRLKQATAAPTPLPPDIPMAMGLTPFPAAQPADTEPRATAPAVPTRAADSPAGAQAAAPATSGQQPPQGPAKPPDWQKRLADVYLDTGSPLYADLENKTIVLFNNRRCRTVFEVVEGGLLGLGTVDPTTEHARHQLTDQLSTLASNVLTIEPGSAGEDEPAYPVSSSLLPQSLQPLSDDAISENEGSPVAGGHARATGDALRSKEVHTSATASSNSNMAALLKENALLKARLQQVEEAATDALGELQDARDEVDAHKQAIKGTEQQVREELASWQDQLAASAAKSAAAEAALLTAQPEIEELQHRVRELQQGNGRLKEQLATQVSVAAAAAARAETLEAQLEAERAGQSAVAADAAARQADVDRMVVAAVAAREEEAERLVAAAQQAMQEALDRAEAARQRAVLAEQAKIELTLALAEAAEGKAKDVDTHTAPPPAEAAAAAGRQGCAGVPSGRASDKDGEDRETDDGSHDGWGDVGDWGDAAAGDGGSKGLRGQKPKGGAALGAAGALAPGETVVQASEMEALLRRTEEAQLAAAVQTRRAAAAEAEADGLKRQLVEAEKRIKDLGWQIQMVMDPVTIGGAGAAGRAGPGGGGGAAGAGASWFADIMGCGANYVRK